MYVDNVAAEQCCQTGVDDFVSDIAVVFDIVVIASIAVSGGGLLLLVWPRYGADRDLLLRLGRRGRLMATEFVLD